MPAYLMVLAEDPAPLGRDPNLEALTDCLSEFGGRYIVRRAVPQVLEGDFPHTRATCLAYPDMDAMRAFRTSDSYQNHAKPLRAGLGQLHVWPMPGDEGPNP